MKLTHPNPNTEIVHGLPQYTRSYTVYRNYSAGDRVLARTGYGGKLRPATILEPSIFGRSSFFATGFGGHEHKADDDDGEDVIAYDVKFDHDGFVQRRTMAAHLVRLATPSSADVENPLKKSLEMKSLESRDAASAGEKAASTWLPPPPPPPLNPEEDATMCRKQAEEMVEEAGDGIYTLASMMVLRRSSAPAWKQVLWTAGAFAFLSLQYLSLVALVLSILAPLCSSQDDCEYTGSVCLQLVGADSADMGSPLCVQCRSAVCFLPTENRIAAHTGTAFDDDLYRAFTKNPNVTLRAKDYCLAHARDEGTLESHRCPVFSENMSRYFAAAVFAVSVLFCSARR